MDFNQAEARAQEIHELRLALKFEISRTPEHLPHHAELTRQLDALDTDSDDAEQARHEALKAKFRNR